MAEEIVNRVAASDLVTFDLEKYYQAGERVVLDIKDQLFQGLVLREKDFREYVGKEKWEQYKGKHVAVTCTAEAVIPVWAYMLLATALAPYANTVVFGDRVSLETRLFLQRLEAEDWDVYRGRRVVVKGCSKVEVPEAVFVEVAARLRQVVASLMFGEACSTVPLFKDSGKVRRDQQQR